MKKLISGFDFKKFYLTDSTKYWPDGWTVEDMELEINGVNVGFDADVEGLADTDKVKILGGWLFTDEGDSVRSVSAHFSRWMADQTCRTMTIQVPLEKVDDIKKAVKEAGGTII